VGTKVSIRPATVDDSVKTAAVFLAARATMSYLPQLHTDDDTRAYIGRILCEHQAIVAEEEERIVGFAVLRDDWLDHLYVDPSRFNRGIGTTLLRAIKELRPDGFQFWVFQQNLGARRLYEQHGCCVAEFTDGSGNEERLPDVRYTWTPLGPRMPSSALRRSKA